MTSEPPENDIRRKWQNQPNEPTRISVEEIRQKAQKLQRKNRREILIFYAFALLFVVFFGRGLATTHEILQRIGFALLVAWALYFPYQAHKRIWPKRSAAEAASTTCLEFYRRELQRRRDYTLHIWQWFLGPLFFSLSVFLLPAVIKAINNPRLWLNLLPFSLLLVLWAALFFPRQRRELRKLQREIDGLDAVQS